MNLSAEDIGPNVEFNDAGRHAILSQIEDRLGSSVSAAAWSCLWLAETATLESKWQDPAFISLLQVGDLDSMVRYWSQRHRQKSTPSSTRCTSSPAPPLPRQTVPSPDTAAPTSQLQSSPFAPGNTPPRGLKRKRGDNGSISEISREPQETHRGRSAVAKQICLARDASACIVTKFPDFVDVAHIFPFSMGSSNPQISPFWNLLRSFWSEERVTSWQNAILPHGTETPKNLICLAPHVHRLYTNGCFALQPIKLSEDQTKLTLRYYWLSKPDLPAWRSVRDRPHIDDNLVELPRHLKIIDVITDRPIRSGDELILETSDPNIMPLPDIRLLDMQWVLQRLMALTSAAEADDDDLDDDYECVDPVRIESSEEYKISDDHFDAVEMWISNQPQMRVPCKYVEKFRQVV
ncbi:hypothetical protein GX51_02629 [Blastomyces parvus]|uniref:HNH nuclease domain-containing protein n=1 Tax=Blastomyces parvus TaxID=2060905 RepID=A0A2B7XBM1_9EURO|nr:hypothetical protein GX51_02629 [Blastomyces parvus]